MSDLITYAIGRALGPKLWQYRYFNRIISAQRVVRIKHFYNKNGLLTILIGRFIPFGLRSALFVTAGFSKMNWVRFSLYDLFAVTVTSSTYFFLYYTFAVDVVEYIKKGHLAIISVVGVIILIAIFNKHRKVKISD